MKFNIKSSFLWLSIIVVIGLSIRLWLAGTLGDSPPWAGDVYNWLQLSRSVESLGYPAAKRLPTYPLAIAIVHLFVQDRLVAARIASALLGVLAIPLLYLLTERLFDKRVALVSSFLLALMPQHVVISTMVMAEVALIPFVLLAFYTYYVGIEDNRMWALSVMSAAFASLARYEGVLLLLAVIIGLLVIKGKRLPRDRVAVAYVASLVTVGLMWFALTSRYGMHAYLFEATSHAGFEWYLTLADWSLLGPLVFALSLVGIVLATQDFQKHLPLMLFLVAYFGLHAWWYEPDVRWLPMLGVVLIPYSAYAIFRVPEVIVRQEKRLVSVTSLLVIGVVLLPTSIYMGISDAGLLSEAPISERDRVLGSAYRDVGLHLKGLSLKESDVILAGDMGAGEIAYYAGATTYDELGYPRVISDNPALPDPFDELPDDVDDAGSYLRQLGVSYVAWDSINTYFSRELPFLSDGEEHGPFTPIFALPAQRFQGEDVVFILYKVT